MIQDEGNLQWDDHDDIPNLPIGRVNSPLGPPLYEAERAKSKE